MIIIKVYLLSVLFWFLIIEITGLIFRKRFIRNVEILDSILEGGEPPKKEGYLKTTLRYLIISFIPTIRIGVFIMKIIITFRPKIIIERKFKEMKENETI